MPFDLSKGLAAFDEVQKGIEAARAEQTRAARKASAEEFIGPIMDILRHMKTCGLKTFKVGLVH